MLAFIRKILLVIIITCLIWVWADKAMTDSRSNVPGTVHIDKSSDPLLWITLNKQTMSSIKLKVSGPAAKIDVMDKQLKERGTLGFDFYMSPSEEKFTSAGTWSLPLQPFVQKSKLIGELGLTVEECQPESVPVEVVKLVNKTLAIQVLNENQVPVTNAILDPPSVEMAVPENWTGDALKATIVLNSQEVEQSAPVMRKPVVEIGAGITRPCDTMVKVSLPSTETKLKDYSIDAPNIGVTFSWSLQGQYKVELVNMSQVLTSALKIRATPEAKDAYDRIPFKMRLNIVEEDKKSAVELSRELIFNLPEEYVRKGEIMVNEAQPRIAKFKLVNISQIDKTAAAPELPASTPTGPKVLN